MRPRVFAGALSVLLVLGCGTEGSRRDASESVERFTTAIARDDGAGACDELTAQTRSALVRQEAKPCREAILGLELPAAADVSETRVYLTSAIAELSHGGTAFLDQAAEGWRISAAGCRATRPGLPYDCMLED